MEGALSGDADPALRRFLVYAKDGHDSLLVMEAITRVLTLTARLS